HRLDGHSEPSCPLVLVRRKAKAATYAAVHEPYTDRPSVRSVSLIQESADGIGMKVEAGGFFDCLLVAFGSSFSPLLPPSPEGEAFQFAEYGFVRTAGKTIVARGKIKGLRVHANDNDISLTVNGKKEPAALRDGFLIFGEAPGKDGATALSPASLEMGET